jgi:hypothetical protein
MEQGAEVYWVGEYVACYELPTSEEIKQGIPEVEEFFSRSRLVRQPTTRRTDGHGLSGEER